LTIIGLILACFLFLAPIQLGWAASGPAYDVVTDDKFVGGSFTCSCGIGSWTSHTYNFFVNKCPYCGGSLAFEEGSASYTSPEN
jgi:hypothetical protein